jgi:3-deoxy-7-phosphoheptulonate synthase/chorismate mutase
MSDEVDRFRALITELDQTILAAANRRLELVAELKRHKEDHDLPFVDPEREAQLLDDLVQTNDGPLSDGGVRALFVELLALTKRELG